MAGYKETVLNDDCVSLWSFDGDAYDSVTRKLIVEPGNPNYIIDEVDNQNPAILHSDNDTYLGYRMGLPSLVTHEQTDQNSISFGYYGYFSGYPGNYPKAYLEIPHSSSYAFPHYGSFSVEFFMIKDSESDYGCEITRPLIRKGSVFNIYIDMPCYQEHNFKIYHPGGNTTVSFSNYLGKSLYGKLLHIVFTWEVVFSGNGNYTGTARFYINGRIASEQTYTYFDTFPNTNIAVPIEIAGRGDQNTLSSDRQTRGLRLDQIAIYDIAISPEMIATHWSKALPYSDFLSADFANNVWGFGDPDSLSDFVIHPSVGSWNGQYIGTRNQVVRYQDGPPNLLNYKSARFTDKGVAVFLAYNYANSYTPSINISGNYSIEFWFKAVTQNRCVLFSCQQFLPPYIGPLLQLNMHDNSYFHGRLQFTESDQDVILNSVFSNDGLWHHVVIQRSGTTLLFWIDGELQDSKSSNVKSLGQPGQIILMDSAPGNLNAEGNICMLALYNYALQEQQIKARASYSNRYIVRGIVTLMGVPYQAVLRFYSHQTGKLIQELQSDPETGEYIAYFYNNNTIDILVFDKNDISVRYRAYGPITPSTISDFPVLI